MTQESELVRIKRKIRALSALTLEKGASESEAMLAMKKVGELLTQYNLSMDEVSMREEPCVTKFYNTLRKKRNVLWETFSGMQKLCGVKAWYGNDRHNGMCWFYFGLESDVDMALYLSDFLTKTEKLKSELFRRSHIYVNYAGHKSIPLHNFRTAFGQRINERLHTLAREREAAEQKSAAYHADVMKERMLDATPEAQVAAVEAKTGTALICLAKEKMIAEEFVKRGPKLRMIKTQTNARYHGGAREAGNNAANNVNLTRPITGSIKTSGLLT